MTAVRVLGEVAVDGRALSRRRERDLLCVLVAAGGRAVAPERLLDEVWGEPDAPLSGVHVTVSRLRHVVAVERTAAGYRLDATVDAWAFVREGEAALGVPTATERLVAATRALEPWSGEAYAGCTAPCVTTDAHRLDELRTTLEQARAEALLDLGHAAAAARLLAPLAEVHPYREALWAALALALSASSRQADALEVLRVLRRRLVDDLGVDPSATVLAAEHRILSRDVVPLQPTRHERRVRTRHCRAGLRLAAAQ